MLFAVATAFLFAGSALCGRQATDHLGSLPANFWRLLAATLALGVATAIFYPHSFSGPTFLWLFISGFVGFGIGDVALYLAFARIGSRLTLLINFSLATVLGAIGDWIWLGDPLDRRSSMAVAIILSGLAIALLGARPTGMKRHGSHAAGIIAAVFAAFGQGFGATISRHAQSLAKTSGIEVSGLSQAFQRVIAGLLVGAAVLLYFRLRAARRPNVPARTRIFPPRSALPWILGAALFGPVIGVSCFQWALLETPNSGIVLAIVSTSPLILIPFAAFLEKDRPTVASVVGGLIAVGGVARLCLLRA